jgi:hypothetical protein
MYVTRLHLSFLVNTSEHTDFFLKRKYWKNKLEYRLTDNKSTARSCKKIVCFLIIILRLKINVIPPNPHLNEA